MLKISKMSDYAIVLLTEMAQGSPFQKNKNVKGKGQERTMSAADLSALTLLSLPTVQLLLKKLAGGGLLLTARGRDGGYQLARPLDQISVYDVLLLMEGAVALTACVEGQDHCDKETHCHLVGRWRKVNQVIMSALADITLADLLSDEKSFHKNFGHFFQTHQASLSTYHRSQQTK